MRFIHPDNLHELTEAGLRTAATELPDGVDIALAALLRFAGWTQQAIGDHMGVPKQTMSDIIRADKTGLTESDLRTAATELPEKQRPRPPMSGSRGRLCVGQPFRHSRV